MKYCRETTLKHYISITHANCVEDINTLIQKEGYLGILPFFTNNEVVINMDCAETVIARLQNRLEKNKSMDMAFGIKNSDATKIQMLMVELRLNYDNPNNLNKEEIEGKVVGSSMLLSNCPPIVKLYIFIFKTNKIQEATNRLFRMIPKINSNYVVMDINTLKVKYFS